MDVWMDGWMDGWTPTATIIGAIAASIWGLKDRYLHNEELLSRLHIPEPVNIHVTKRCNPWQ